MDPEQSIEERLEAALAEPEQETPEPEAVEALPDASDSEEPAKAAAEEEPDDSEEIEYEGAAYRVPKELKEALLRQSDYTRKTQDLARQRKSVEELEAALKQEREFHAVAFDHAAEVKALDAQIKRFDAVDWNQLAETDTAEFLKLDRTYRALQEQRARKSEEAQQAFSAAQQAAQQRMQVAIAKAGEELNREIKGWGAELQKSLAETGRTYGFNDRELSTLIDPRMVKVLHDAHQWRSLQKSKPEVQKRVVAAKPVTVSARTSQSAQDASKYTEARAALKKHGRLSDAEKALEMRFAKRMR